jgi:uncharacterized protein with von Willebrand factor type A (vWA) domain
VPEDVVPRIVSFARALRAAGARSAPVSASEALRGLAEIDASLPRDVYWTLRQTLVSRREDLELFDRLFGEWFEEQTEGTSGTPAAGALAGRRSDSGSEPARTDATAATEEETLGWSREEVLRRKDFAAMTEDELAEVRALMSTILSERPQRRTRRLRPHARGRQLDLRRVARAALGTGGDPFERAFRRPVSAPRKLVLLCDVSGSMEPYARALLLFMHAAVGSGPGVEVFAFGTRLSRLTPAVVARDPERALAAVAQRVADWSGGTRIGDSLRQFNAEWGRRTNVRGAVVVIASDGWERDDTRLVATEMARLARVAYAVVWVNPLKGHPGYQPLAGGMRAALPYIDRFLPGTNLADLEALAGVIAGIERRHAA